MKHHFIGLSFLLSLNLTAEEFVSKEVIALRNTYRTYIRYTLPIPQIASKKDPYYTPHYRLMTEILKEKPDFDEAKKIISTSTIEQIDDGNLISPLMAAAVLGHQQILDLLLARQVKVNQINRRQQSAAMLAVMTNNLEGLFKLINAGAQLDIKDNQENDASLYAQTRGHSLCIKIIRNNLLIKGINRD